MNILKNRIVISQVFKLNIKLRRADKSKANL
jgi:hypothetical protein